MVDGNRESADEFPLPGSLPASAPGRLTKVRSEWIDFYDYLFSRVVRFIMLLGASREDAADAAQEAFVESWALIERDPNRWEAINNKAAWVYMVARRRHMRPPGVRVRPLVAADEMPDYPDVELGPEELTIQTQSVLRALSILDEEARAVIAFDMSGVSTAHIADALGINEQRVRDIRKRARARLKRELPRNATQEGR